MKKIRAKSIVAALMAGVMLFGLAGCGAGDSEGRKNDARQGIGIVWRSSKLVVSDGTYRTGSERRMWKARRREGGGVGRRKWEWE